MGNYYIDQLVKCRGTFTDEDGVALDPDVVLFQFRTPPGVYTAYTYGVDAELVKEDTGIYYVAVDADTVGAWHYRFYSTGVGQAAGEDRFDIMTLADWP